MKRILVVDDNLATLQQIATQLSERYRVLRAKSGFQALTIALEQKPDLVLLDIDMPGMDGFETLAALREYDDLKRIPVIFLTGNHDAATQVRALEAGGVDFIKKPVSKGVLLHRLQLHLSLFQYQQSLEKTVHDLEDSIISAFAELIECRDTSNGGHVQRTREYLAALGKMLLDSNAFPENLDKDRLAMMVRAAPLHDIGKIGVSDTIIRKPSMLTDDEFSTIKTHTVVGARALERIYERMPTQYYMGYAILMALGHHERYDGLGYPHGIAGEDIPLCSRIMAVANVYDSLVVASVYRKALSHTEACEILADGRGTEFDPMIIDIFLKNHEAFAKIAAAFFIIMRLLAFYSDNLEHLVSLLHVGAGERSGGFGVFAHMPENGHVFISGAVVFHVNLAGKAAQNLVALHMADGCVENELIGRTAGNGGSVVDNVWTLLAALHAGAYNGGTRGTSFPRVGKGFGGGSQTVLGVGHFVSDNSIGNNAFFLNDDGLGLRLGFGQRRGCDGYGDSRGERKGEETKFAANDHYGDSFF